MVVDSDYSVVELDLMLVEGKWLFYTALRYTRRNVKIQIVSIEKEQ